MTNRKHFRIACRECGHGGDLFIESGTLRDWDYCLTGFAATVHPTGAEAGSIECFRCGSGNAELTPE